MPKKEGAILEVELAKISGEIALLRQELGQFSNTLVEVKSDLTQYKEKAEQKFAAAGSLNGLFKIAWVGGVAIINILISAVWSAIIKHN